ncbi:hypothetical protein B0H14DRAFT_2618204 [Mycena olivaceomarginata]|nr:hypothetical protein B0H14DRAFT_2618204 [Mycena olivaceomarginata]
MYNLFPSFLLLLLTSTPRALFAKHGNRARRLSLLAGAVSSTAGLYETLLFRPSIGSGAGFIYIKQLRSRECPAFIRSPVLFLYTHLLGALGSEPGAAASLTSSLSGEKWDIEFYCAWFKDCLFSQSSQYSTDLGVLAGETA